MWRVVRASARVRGREMGAVRVEAEEVEAEGGTAGGTESGTAGEAAGGTAGEAESGIIRSRAELIQTRWSAISGLSHFGSALAASMRRNSPSVS